MSGKLHYCYTILNRLESSIDILNHLQNCDELPPESIKYGTQCWSNCSDNIKNTICNPAAES